MNSVVKGVLAVCLAFSHLVPAIATAAIDFETTSTGFTPTDDAKLTGTYIQDMTVVAFGFDVDAGDGVIQIDSLAVFEDRIPPDWEPTETLSAYSSGSGPFLKDPDFTATGEGGTWMIRRPKVIDITFQPFVIEFSGVLPNGVSGEVWDLDARPFSGADAEEYTVTALDSLDQVIATIVSPLGISETSPGTLDGRPWHWSFVALPAPIKKVTIHQTQAPKKGFAFDNFAIVADPTGIPPSLSTSRFSLQQNIPNPFNPLTVIRYTVPVGGGKVSIAVYDVNGRFVKTLLDAFESSGTKRVTWDGRDDRGAAVASGIYFYRLTARGFSETRKMLLLK